MIKTLARSIREYKKAAILTPLLVTVEVILECIIPFTIANLVNQMQAGCGMDVIVRYGVQLVVMAVLSLVFGVAAGNTCATASTGFARNLRRDMFYRIQDYSFENIDKFSVSSLVTRMTTDVVNVQMSFMMIIRVAIRGPLMLIFSFVMGFAMGGRLAMIFLVTIPLLSVGLVLVIRAATPIFRRVFRKYDALNDSVQENVQAMRVVKSYVRERYEKKKFAAAAEDVCSDFTRAERIMALNSPMMQFCVYAGMAFVLSFGSYAVISSQGAEIAVGQMSAILTYSFQILMSLMTVSMVFVMITMSMESAERIVEVLSEKSNLTSPEGALTEVKDGSIDFDAVSFKYAQKAERMALADVDLHIKSGEVIGVLGGTGSSKSTLVQLFPDKYDTWIEQGGSNVSGGQKQRLCIARALMKKPKVLILDDSTSAVDTRTDALIRQGFREFIPETTKIIIAQRVASVQDADRIVVMDGGRISAIGSHDELMKTSEIYREVYTTQNKAGDQDGEE